MSNLRAELIELAHRLDLAVEFPEEVLAEVRAHQAAPGVDDAALTDRTDLPFVTIDGPTSKDLDQAVHLAREGDGFVIHYAIADASYYVRPGSALFREAMRRGATYYFPGWSVPMLPRELSEGIISLNDDGPRRALLFTHTLDARGELKSTTLVRARVHSRAKLSFGEVQALVDGRSFDLVDTEYEASLRLLQVVGRLRVALAEARGLVRYRREEVQIELADGGASFAVMEVVRDEVELWNEQISLLCNAEGGRLLREHPSPAVQPIYRVHAGPASEKLEAFAKLTGVLAELHALPRAVWAWVPEQTCLADYLRGLPRGSQGSVEDRIGRTVARQAVMVNLRSEYSTEPAPHVGVGAEPYARFSAPMREMIGVFLHKEAVEMLTGVHPPVEEDEALRAEVVLVANRARETQRRVQDAANELVLDRLFRPELARPLDTRTRFRATVLGITSSKVHLRLEAPPIDVKLYLRDLGKDMGGAWLEVDPHGTLLTVRDAGTLVLRLGDSTEVCVARRDETQRRWVLALCSRGPTKPANGRA